MNTRTEFEEAIVAEVTYWPRCGVTFGMGGKHPIAILEFDGLKTKQPFPGSASDRRSKLNAIGNTRRALKGLGAERAKPESADEDGPDVELNYRKPVDRSGIASNADLVKSDPVEQTDPRDVFKKIAKPKALDLPLPDIAAGEVVKEAIKTAIKDGPLAGLGVVARAVKTAEEMAEAEALFKALVDSIEDGVYFGLPDKVYHAVPRLSASGLQKLCVSPGTFWKGSWLDPDREDFDSDPTPAQVLGKAFHCARLEPEEFEKRFCRQLDKSDFDQTEGFAGNGTDIGSILGEMGHPKTKAGESVLEKAQRLEDAGFSGVIWPLEQARWQAALGGRTPIPAEFWDDILTDMERIRGVSDIADLLTGGAAEVSIFWTDAHGLKRKCRPDYLRDDTWVDLKSFANPNGKELDQAIADAIRFSRYYVQGAFYRDGIETLRTGGLQIKSDATDDQRRLVASIQMRPTELDCWYVFQEKGGVPNMVAYQFDFHEVPDRNEHDGAGATDAQKAAQDRVTRTKTELFVRAEMDIERCLRAFTLYSQVYQPGEPWFPIEPRRSMRSLPFNSYWMEGRT